MSDPDVRLKTSSAILVSCVAISSVCFFANLPLLPLVLKERDPNALGGVGVIVSISFLVAAILSPIWGWFADRFGPKLMMQRAAVFVSFAYFLTAIAPNFEFLLGARIVNGLASGLIPSAYTWAARNFSTGQQGTVFGALNSGKAAGAIAGPALASFATFLGSSNVLITIAVLSLLNVLIIGFLPSSTIMRNQNPVKKSFYRDEDKPRLNTRNKSLIGIGVLLAAASLGYSAVGTGLQTALPLQISTLAPGSSYQASGLMFTIAGVSTLVLSPLWGRTIDNSNGRTGVFGLAFASIPIAVLWVVGGEASILLIIVSYVAFTALSLPVGILANIVAIKLTNRYGLALGSQNQFAQIGAAIGPFVAGIWISNSVWLNGVLTILSAISCVALASSLVLSRKSSAK